MEPRASAGRRALSRFLIIGAVVAAVALLGYGLASKAPDDSIDQSLAQGEPASAPGFELPVLADGDLPTRLARAIAPATEDGRLGLSELRGTPVVLNFWASWCTPCRAEAATLADGWERFGPDGVLFLGLDMQDLTDDATQFIDEYGNDYLNVRDQTDAVATDWGVTGIPETFFISADGRVTSHVIGAISAPQLRSGVSTALSGRPLAPASGGPQRPTR